MLLHSVIMKSIKLFSVITVLFAGILITSCDAGTKLDESIDNSASAETRASELAQTAVSATNAATSVSVEAASTSQAVSVNATASALDLATETKSTAEAVSVEATRAAVAGQVAIDSTVSANAAIAESTVLARTYRENAGDIYERLIVTLQENLLPATLLFEDTASTIDPSSSTFGQNMIEAGGSAQRAIRELNSLASELDQLTPISECAQFDANLRIGIAAMLSLGVVAEEVITTVALNPFGNLDDQTFRVNSTVASIGDSAQDIVDQIDLCFGA